MLRRLINVQMFSGFISFLFHYVTQKNLRYDAVKVIFTVINFPPLGNRKIQFFIVKTRILVLGLIWVRGCWTKRCTTRPTLIILLVQ